MSETADGLRVRECPLEDYKLPSVVLKPYPEIGLAIFAQAGRGLAVEDRGPTRLVRIGAALIIFRNLLDCKSSFQNSAAFDWMEIADARPGGSRPSAIC
jgi:hypothetical protein